MEVEVIVLTQNESSSAVDQAPTIQMDERRDWVRHPCDLRAYCQPGSGRLESVWWAAQVLNLSATGIRLGLHSRLKPGAVMIVELQNQARDYARTVRVEVIHATIRDDRGWTLGCAFLDPLTAEELHTLLS